MGTIRTLPGSQDVVAAMFGAEYQTYEFNRAVHDHDVPSAVCYNPCIDSTFKLVVGSATTKGGVLFCPVEGRCGSLSCPAYEQARELRIMCALCTNFR